MNQRRVILSTAACESPTAAAMVRSDAPCSRAPLMAASRRAVQMRACSAASAAASSKDSAIREAQGRAASGVLCEHGHAAGAVLELGEVGIQFSGGLGVGGVGVCGCFHAQTVHLVYGPVNHVDGRAA